MAEPLFDLLVPYFDHESQTPSSRDSHTAAYLTRLTTLSLLDLTTNEPASLSQSAQSHLRNLQALSKRSHKAVISSASHLTSLSSLLPALGSKTRDLSDGIPQLETAAATFAQKYSRNTENSTLDRRKKVMLLSRNVDRVVDILDLPSLLSSTISSAQANGTGASNLGGGMSTSYSFALDLNGHIKRLTALFPHSQLIGTIAAQSEMEIQYLASVLVTSLQNPSLKLAGAMRTIGWLRRVAPELVDDASKLSRLTSTKTVGLTTSSTGNDDALGSLFILCRLRTLYHTLEALEPLRDLADHEVEQQRRQITLDSKSNASISNTIGSQSERYLKRYIEIFREQSFNILSMYRSIFPDNISTTDSPSISDGRNDELLFPLPSPASPLALHLVDMLTETLRSYLPNVRDVSARESLLTQILYCAGSLGRLGADFGLMIALLEEDLQDAQASHDDQENPEWARVMERHRVQASRLEVLARGVGTGRKTGLNPSSPLSPSPPTPIA